MRKVAMVTGGASRQGRVLAAALAETGFDLVIHPRGPAGWAREAARAVSAHGRQAFLVEADPSDPGAMQGAMEAVRQAYGRLDVLVACGCRPGEAARASTVVVGAAAPLLGRSGGTVVQLLEPPPSDGEAREALFALTRGMSRLLAPRIRVNGVSPPPGGAGTGGNGSPSLKEGGAARAEADLVRAVLFLLGAPHLNGEILVADRSPGR